MLVIRISLLLLVVALPVAVGADTIVLTDGGKIEDCRILEEREDVLMVRTRAGRMHVPREMIKKVIQKESVFDVYDRKVAAASEDDAARLFEVADWCRAQGGLRPEMDALLEKALAVDPSHRGTRHLLGYVWDTRGWVQLPPLSIKLVMENHEQMEEAVRNHLGTVLGIRRDVQFVESLDEVKDAHGCELVVDMSMKKTKAAKFYRMRIKGPCIHANVRLEPRGKLVGRKAPKIKLRGEVVASQPTPRAKAVGDAFARKPATLHGLFDEIQRRRIEVVEAALARAAAPGEGTPTDDVEGAE